MSNPRIVVLLPLMASMAAHTAQASEALMEKSGCLSCHRVDQKLIGPTFKEVATRYRGRNDIVPILLQKVREGGEGEWGDIPMAANSEERVSDDNLKAVIEWILSL
ncbi:MAG: c-type cytochrome [Steroidobacteraceae bacterium]